MGVAIWHAGQNEKPLQTPLPIPHCTFRLRQSTPKESLTGTLTWNANGSLQQGKPRYSWSESPPLYHHLYSISDEAIAAVDSSNIIVSEFGTKRWRTAGKGSGFCASHNMPTLYSDKQLVYGCDKFTATSTDGHVLMTDSFPTGDASSGKTTVAQAGRFVAISVDTTKVKTNLLSEPSVRITATHIVVYDLVLKKRVLTVSVEPLPKNDYDVALSPDGSKLAILNDRNVSVCSVPVQPTENTTIP